MTMGKIDGIRYRGRQRETDRDKEEEGMTNKMARTENAITAPGREDCGRT